jgi:hypothetical protein
MRLRSVDFRSVLWELAVSGRVGVDPQIAGKGGQL